MEENIFKSADKIIGFDLDNTIWDWVKLKNLEISAMTTSLKEELNNIKFDLLTSLIKQRRTNNNDSENLIKYEISIIEKIKTEQEIKDSISNVYKKAKTPDTSELIQKMDIFSGISTKTETRLINICKETCINVRENEMFLFDGIYELLKAIKNNRNMVMFALSDAPMSQALIRIMQTNRERCFNVVFAQKNIDSEELSKRVEKKAEQNGIRFEYLPNQKPDLDLSNILGLTKEEVKKKIIFIGDSLKKDGGLALINECKFFHAEYGQAKQDQLDKMAQIMGGKNVYQGDTDDVLIKDYIKLESPEDAIPFIN